MKKVLFVATVVQKHINVFHIPFLKLFQNNGYKTYVAASNDTGSDNVSIEHCDEYIEIDFKRNPLHLGNISAYLKLKKVIEEHNFDIIHCHTPVGGLLGRLAARKVRKKGTRVLYTAHGFHFYKGAPLKNWLLYYPVEKICSCFTDTLVTINQEDYSFAKRKMKAKEIKYVPGVGIDISRFQNIDIDRAHKRREIGVPEDAFLLISVGELNENKNHQVIIKALAKIGDPNIHYAIAGIGDKREYLLELANELGVAEQVHLLGYRSDVIEINFSADAFCCPSLREGLSVSTMEAMACGLPVVCSKIRGNSDLLGSDYEFLCEPNGVDAFADAIRKIAKNSDLYNLLREKSLLNVTRFSKDVVLEEMKTIYGI